MPSRLRRDPPPARAAARRSPMSRAGRACPRPRCRSRSTTGRASRPETRERILAAARELGWRPSASARALTEARTRAVGLVLARNAAQLEGDSFFVRFLSGIERALTAADYALLLQIVPGEASTALPAYERLAAAGRVDGFLLTDVEADDPRFALLAGRRVPVVLAGRPAGRVRRSRGWRRATTRASRRRSSTWRSWATSGSGSSAGARVRARAAARGALAAALAAAGLPAGPVCTRRRSARGGAGAAAPSARPRSSAPATRWRSAVVRRGARAGLAVPGGRLGDGLRRLARSRRSRRPR